MPADETYLYNRRSMPQIVPQDQVDAVESERRAVLDQYTVIQAEIDQLKADADFLEFSVNAISDKALTQPKAELFMREVVANRKAAASLRASITRMEDLLEEHAKTR